MKNLILLTTTLLMLFSATAFGQRKKNRSVPIDTLYARDLLEIKKMYPDIIVYEMSTSDPKTAETTMRFNRSVNYAYPTEAKETGIQGNVYYRFLTDTMGNIFDIKVIKGLGGGCTEATVSALKDRARSPFKVAGQASNFFYIRYFCQYSFN